MSELRNTINKRMDILQQWLESNYHLSRPEVVLEHIQTVSKFWSVLSEEDREYIQCAQHAIEEKMEWLL
jgi:hypothetical protein